MLFRRTFSLLRPYRAEVALGLLCIAVSSPLTLWLPRLLGGAIDALVHASSGSDDAGALLTRSCLLILAVGTAEATSKYVARRTLIHASRKVEETLKNRLVTHLSTLPVSWFDRARTGDLISRLTQDVELLRFIAGPTLLHGGAALLIIPGGIWMMATLSWKVFAVGVAVFGALTAALLFLVPRMHQHSKKVQESISDISQRCAEDFAGIRVIATFGRAPAEARVMARMCQDYLEHNVRLSRMRALVNLFIAGCRELVVLGVLVVGVLEAIAGNLSIGQLFEFLMLVGIMVWPLIAISWLLGTLQRARAAAERIEEIFAAQPESQAGKDVELSGHLVVKDLTFTYEGASRPALRDISFELLPGQKLGLVGPIGSGKSTLLDLVTRLYEPPPGTMFVDGFDVRELSPAALRRAFAVAPQDPFLFSDTIRGNVAFGSATDQENVARAVHTAALDQDLETYPEGLESVVGERGITLSGGQKQRVSLARALAAERGALLLDDTLSAVDHHTEAQILARLRAARGGRTTVVASHRVSAVADADLILVLDGGRIVERGTPQELLAAGGYYAAAWARQRERNALEGVVD
jgi:ATP-binding cassette subfamily B protein